MTRLPSLHNPTQNFPLFSMARTTTRTHSKLLAAIQAKCVKLIFLCYLISTVNAQPKIPSKAPLYVFGDSLYDTGTALYVNHGPAANSNPYGMTYFKKPSGRFSDGLLIPDFIAQFAGLPLPEPYSNPNLKDYTKSVNFADAAAGVLVETRPSTLNLKLQTQSFVEMTQKLTQQYGQAQTQTLLSKAVLLFNIGTNDYIDIYNKNKRPLSTALTTRTRQNVIGNFSIHLTTMYNQGARNFAFQGSAPVGCLPAYREADGSCSQELNSLAKMHNFRLKALCKSLVAQLPGFKYSYYDFYASLSTRLNNGPAYGFTETQTACCGSGRFNGVFSCGNNKEKFTVCANPNTYLFFDPAHPTQKADKEFAQEFWTGSNNLVTPRSLASLF